MTLKAKHLQQGEDAELACYHYLKKNGLKPVTKNFHCRHGEIDIIMLDNKTLVFVEVRFRKNNHFGDGLESITANKQNKLRRTAELYLQKNKQYKNARFDVVSMSKSITPNEKTPCFTFDWVSNAF